MFKGVFFVPEAVAWSSKANSVADDVAVPITAACSVVEPQLLWRVQVDFPFPGRSNSHPGEPRERAAPSAWPAVVRRADEQHQEPRQAGGAGDGVAEPPWHVVLHVDDDRGADHGGRVEEDEVPVEEHVAVGRGVELAGAQRGLVEPRAPRADAQHEHRGVQRRHLPGRGLFARASSAGLARSRPQDVQARRESEHDQRLRTRSCCRKFV